MSEVSNVSSKPEDHATHRQMAVSDGRMRCYDCGVWLTEASKPQNAQVAPEPTGDAEESASSGRPAPAPSQHSEQLLAYAKSSIALAHGDKTEDELLQRIWNLSEDVRNLVEQLEALDEKPNQPLLNAARRLVKATDNAERNYALADLVAALEEDSIPATSPKYPAGRFDYGDTDPAREPKKPPSRDTVGFWGGVFGGSNQGREQT